MGPVTSEEEEAPPWCSDKGCPMAKVVDVYIYTYIYRYIYMQVHVAPNREAPWLS